MEPSTPLGTPEPAQPSPPAEPVNTTVAPASATQSTESSTTVEAISHLPPAPATPPAAEPIQAPAPAEPVLITPTVATPVSTPVSEIIGPKIPAVPAIVNSTPVTGNIVVGSGFEAGKAVPIAIQDTAKKAGRFPKATLVGMLAVALIAVGGLAYYFGYYTNSTVVYGQALGNTGKGLTALTHEFIAKPKIAYKGYVGSGSYKFSSDSFSTDGKFAFKSDNENSETTFDVGAATSRVNIAIRTTKSASQNPDIYFKAVGIKGLGASLGQPDVDTLTTKYDDKWIVVDHTLLDNIQKQVASADQTATPTSAEIMDEMDAASKVNQDYLFSDDKNKAVTTVIKTFGQETVEGHKVVHYQVGFNKPNLKKYLTAQEQVLLKSKLGDYLKRNKLTEDVDREYKQALKSVDDIKATDTFEMYADINSRLIYKLRFPADKNPVENYVDAGLDYKSNKELPFFVSGTNKSGSDKTDFSIKVKANSETKAVDVNVLVTGSGSSKMSIASTFSFKPTAEAPSIVAPTGAVQVAQLLQDLGLGSPENLFSGLGDLGGGLGGGGRAKDAKRHADISALQTQLEAYYAQEGVYPTYAQFNDSAWRKINMRSLDQTALTDPDGSGTTLATTPAAKIYAYQSLNTVHQACTNVRGNDCQSYTLTATLSDGKPYMKLSLN